jgi:hypothetical protein
MRDTMRERVGFTRSGTGYDQERSGGFASPLADAMLDGLPLLRIYFSG